MKVRWTPQALQDRSDIFAYLAARDSRAAHDMDQSFSDAILPLVDFPMIGRIGSVVGTREIFPHESYRLVYEIFGETIWVLALVHTAQAWPPVNDEGRD